MARKKKPGKYAGVVEGLPAKRVEDMDRQDIINVIKGKLTSEGNTIADIAALYAQARRNYDKVQAEQSLRYLQIEAYQQMFTAAQEVQDGPWGMYGVEDNAIKLPDGSTIRVDEEPQGQVIDKEALRQWCIANGYEHKLQPHHKTMNSWVKERLLNGEPLPDGTEAVSYKKVVFTDGAK